MVFKDYYKILNLETSRVSINEIKNAYRIAAKKNHPDVNIQDKLAEEKIKDINEAYRILSNSSSKRKYDRIWNANVKKQNEVRMDESVSEKFMHIFFGNKEDIEIKDNKPGNSIKGENIETEISISIEEGFYGLNKRISFKNYVGEIKTYDIKIPAGIMNGEKIRLIGQGKPGKNGGKAGDLYIKVNILNTKIFKLKGSDIYTDLLITPWEAALGTRLQINSIDTSTQIYIPKGIQAGETLKIQGKGYKIVNEKRGDLIAEVKIVMPKNLTEEENNIFKKLSKISKFNPRNEIEFT